MYYFTYVHNVSFKAPNMRLHKIIWKKKTEKWITHYSKKERECDEERERAKNNQKNEYVPNSFENWQQIIQM